MRRYEGFTLVELVLVIALSAVVGVMISTVLSRPLEGFVAQSRRAELTDLAAVALNRMAREVRQAVPNSLRLTGSNTLELLAIHEAGRYRASALVDGGMRHDPPRCPASGVCRIEVLSPGLAAERVRQARWMVIYNTGANVAGATVWPPLGAAALSVVTPDGAGFTLDAGQLSLSGAAGFGFRYASPQHRFYLAREVLGYRCENVGELAGSGSGRLLRASFEQLQDGYSYANSPVLVDSVSRCEFTYEPGTNTRGGLLTIGLGVMKDGEEVVLLQQIHVDNAP